MSEIILLAGLPGSGKTTHLCQMRDHWLVFDDYKREAFNDCSKFGSSRKFLPLIAALHAGLKCVVADIDFCKTESREEAQRLLVAISAGLSLSWCFFENDPIGCEVNIRSRNRPCIDDELRNLERLSILYRIPQGAIVFPVTRNTSRYDAGNRELRTENCS